MLRRTDREQALLNTFQALAADMIGEYDGFGIVGDDNTFRGPAPSRYVISARVDDRGVVVLRIQRKDLPWRREIRIASNESWKETTDGGLVERSGSHFQSEQGAILARLFEHMRGTAMPEG
jgi:hypothetical protein